MCPQCICIPCANYLSCHADCSPGGVPGLFIVIAAVCIIVVCVIGLSANLVTFCIARRNSKRTRHSRSRVLQQTTERIEANCPFIIEQQMEESNQVVDSTEQTAEQFALNQRSLEEFFELQYSRQTEANPDSHRMSWV